MTLFVGIILLNYNKLIPYFLNIMSFISVVIFVFQEVWKKLHTATITSSFEKNHISRVFQCFEVWDEAEVKEM